MQVRVSGRHMSVTEAMKGYAEEKSQKLIRFHSRIQEIRVVLDFEGGLFKAECIADVERQQDFIAHETGADMYAAIDAVLDKLERQLKKHRDRVKEHHKRGAAEAGH